MAYFESRVILFKLFCRCFSVDGGSFEIIFLVDFHVIGKNVPHDDQVVLDIVHCQAVHAQILWEQRLA